MTSKAGSLVLLTSRETVEGRRIQLGDTHPHTLDSWNNLIDLYETWGKPEKVDEWRAKLLRTESLKE